MKQKKAILVALGLASTGMAYAECSIELPYPQLVDCIVEEGASDRYRPVESEPEQENMTSHDKKDAGQKLTFVNKDKKVN